MRPFLVLVFFTWFFNLFLGWWATIVPALLIGAWLFDRSQTALYIGFFAGGLAWLIQAFYVDMANDAILSTRIAEMMQVGSPWIVLLITFLVGGILTAVSALLGFQIKKVLHPQSSKTIN